MRYIQDSKSADRLPIEEVRGRCRALVRGHLHSIPRQIVGVNTGRAVRHYQFFEMLVDDLQVVLIVLSARAEPLHEAYRHVRALALRQYRVFNSLPDRR